jgi:hypothetical protein
MKVQKLDGRPLSCNQPVTACFRPLPGMHWALIYQVVTQQAPARILRISHLHKCCRSSWFCEDYDLHLPCTFLVSACRKIFLGKTINPKYYRGHIGRVRSACLLYISSFHPLQVARFYSSVPSAVAPTSPTAVNVLDPEFEGPGVFRMHRS